jgi:hypothetical protein
MHKIVIVAGPALGYLAATSQTRFFKPREVQLLLLSQAFFVTTLCLRKYHFIRELKKVLSLNALAYWEKNLKYAFAKPHFCAYLFALFSKLGHFREKKMFFIMERVILDKL